MLLVKCKAQWYKQTHCFFPKYGQDVGQFITLAKKINLNYVQSDLSKYIITK